MRVALSLDFWRRSLPLAERFDNLPIASCRIEALKMDFTTWEGRIENVQAPANSQIPAHKFQQNM
jgi:hypothetical protein